MSEQTNDAPSYGERLVRVDFNPSGDALVNELKQQTAAIIDGIKVNEALNPRLAALAITTYENAAMWAVKLLTTKPA